MKYRHIMSVDVEEWYQGEFTRNDTSLVKYTDVVNSIRSIVELFESFQIKATFFVVGELVERHPEILSILIENEHEVGFHGWDHKPLWIINPHGFYNRLLRFQELLNEWDYTPIGYRAPSASLDNGTSWALNELKKMGYRYDSSVYPSKTFLYGVPTAPIYPYWPSKERIEKPTLKADSNQILELPLLTFGPSRFRIPLGTGFYLRTFPIGLYYEAIKHRTRQNIPAVISFHTWEFSRSVPKTRTSILNRFYLYHGLGHCRKRVESLLERFHYTSIENWLKLKKNVKTPAY